MVRKSSVLKMLTEIADNRKIITFPMPFKVSCTPYEKYDFDEKIKLLAREEKTTLSASLNICKMIVLGDVAVGKTCIINR